MKLDTTTIRIPGLSRTYIFYHTSDCHIAYAAPDESAEAQEKARKMTEAWSYTGLLPSEALKQVLLIAEEDKVDGLFLCGDVADYLTESTVGAVREALNATRTEKFYVCGNHERSGAEEGRGFYPAYEDMMHGTPGFWTCDFGEFVIVGMDDGDKLMSEKQLDMLEAQFAKGKPILLLIHIPILTDAIMGPVKEKWGENGPDYFLLGKPSDTELSRRFCRMLADPDAPIAAVFAGHIHLQHTGEIIPGRMQYVSGPAFEGVIRKYLLTDSKEIIG